MNKGSQLSTLRSCTPILQGCHLAVELLAGISGFGFSGSLWNVGSEPGSVDGVQAFEVGACDFVSVICVSDRTSGSWLTFELVFQVCYIAHSSDMMGSKNLTTFW